MNSIGDCPQSMWGEVKVGHAYRVLRVAFESRAELDREFFNNLVHAALLRESGLRVQHREIDLEDPKRSKVEQSILGLAGLGMNIARLIETIQEPDGLIEGCILDLVERGAVRYEANGASH